MSSRRSLIAVATVAVVLAACGSGDPQADGSVPPATPVPTIAGVGAVPGVPSVMREPFVVVRPPLNEDGTEARPLGEVADGNRVLLIGDSILASTSSRYGNQVCDALVPLGWRVAVEAEPSRFIDFGNLVLDRVLPDKPGSADDWNVAVVFLGSNYGGSASRYEKELVEILDRLAPRPVLLFTVTEYRPNYVEVNQVVERQGAARDNVTVLDWRTTSSISGILSSDRLHPTNTGRRVLAESIAVALGPIGDGDGSCLRSTFSDDSSISGDSATVLGSATTGSNSGGSSTQTTTTVRTSTSTTTSVTDGGGGAATGSSTTTTVASDDSSTTSTPATTVAPVTPTTAASTTTSAPTSNLGPPDSPEAPADPLPSP